MIGNIFSRRKKVIQEYQPWHLSYQKSLEARPSWSKHGMPALFNNFIRLVKQNNRKDGISHLDIGCGNGVKTVNYALAGFQTTGVDISEDGFKEARELFKELRLTKKCKVTKASALDLPFEDEAFKSASDVLMFTHLKSKDYDRYKSELLRVLKPEAFILLVLFSDKDEHFHGHKVSKRYTFKFDPTNPLMEAYSHYHGMYNVHFNKKEIKKIFGRMFEIIEMEEVKHPLYPHRNLWNVILRKPNGKSSSN